MFFQHQANVDLVNSEGGGGVGGGKFSKRDYGSRTYQYLCVINPINSLYMMDYFSSNINQIINFIFKKIKDFDKNKKNIEEYIEMFLTTDRLNESYLSFIKTLNFTEMIGFLDALKMAGGGSGGGGGGGGDSKVIDFCKLYLDNNWFHKNKYIFPFALLFYHQKTDLILNSRRNIFKLMSEKLDELGVLKSYLSSDTRFRAFDFMKQY